MWRAGGKVSFVNAEGEMEMPDVLIFAGGMMVGAALGMFAMGLLAGGAERRERERRPCPR